MNRHCRTIVSTAANQSNRPLLPSHCQFRPLAVLALLILAGTVLPASAQTYRNGTDLVANWDTASNWWNWNPVDETWEPASVPNGNGTAVTILSYPNMWNGSIHGLQVNDFDYVIGDLTVSYDANTYLQLKSTGGGRLIFQNTTAGVSTLEVVSGVRHMTSLATIRLANDLNLVQNTSREGVRLENISAHTSGLKILTISGTGTGTTLGSGLNNGSGTLRIVWDVDSAFTMNGFNNGYTGGTVVNGGRMNVGNTALGTGKLELNGGDIRLTRTNASFTYFSGATELNANAIIDFSNAGIQGTLGALSIVGDRILTVSGAAAGGNTLVFGATTLAGNATFNVTSGTSNPNTLRLGAVSDGSAGHSLTKTGSGKLILSGASTYTGRTTITGGTIQLTGTMTSPEIEVQAGTFNASAAPSLPTFTLLQGSGTINPGANTVVLAAGGQLAPGNSPGTLEVQGNLDLSAIADTGGLVFELGSPDADLVLLTNGGILNVGTLNFADFTFSPIAGFGLGTYTLFDTGTTILGSIGVDQGTVGGIKAFLSFANDGQDVILTVIPEPASAVLLALAGLAIHRRRR